MKISRPTAPSVRPTYLITGALGALWAALIGVVIAALPIYLTQVTSSSSSNWGSTLRSGAALWLVGHDVPIRLGSVEYSLLPWGLLIIPVTLLVLAGRWAAHVSHARTRGERVIVIASAVVVYAALGLLASVLCSDGAVSVGAVSACLTTALVAVLAFGWGVARSEIAARRETLSATWQVIVRAASVAVIVLIALTSVILLIALISGFQVAVDMQQALNAGPVGGLVLLLLGIGYLPMMLTWTLAYSAGSAVTIGAGSVISPFVPNSVPTELPPFPLLAALPTGSSTAQWFLPVLIVAAGVLVGLWLSRRIVLPALRRAGAAAASCALASAVVLLATVMSHGSVGAERLRELGPAPWLTTALVFALLCVGSIPVVLAFGRRPIRVMGDSAPPSENSEQPVVIDLPVAEHVDETVNTPSSVLDQSATQVIVLPKNSETTHE